MAQLDYQSKVCCCVSAMPEIGNLFAVHLEGYLANVAKNNENN